uniref:Carbohydrate kinase PfkB domain-containing protein n=1 Tax=Panagrolaimus sp. JU765 TaxID=591449 RepID=A0AC34QTF3_9BILA
EQLFENRDLVVIDANLRVETISAVIEIAKAYKIKVWFEPTDLAKATKIVVNQNLEKIDGLSPNFNEMIELSKTFGMKPMSLDEFEKLLHSDFLPETGIFKTAEMILRKMKADDATIFVTMGPVGTLALKKTDGKIVTRIVVPPVIGIHEKMVSASGAGDA